MDIVEQLRERAMHVLEGSGIMCSAPYELLERAANEIEHLRSLAGAVSQGQSFADIRAHIDVARPHPILKAFDGA